MYSEQYSFKPNNYAYMLYSVSINLEENMDNT